MSHLSESESDTGGGVDWATTGLAAHLESACVCVCARLQACRFCDRANAARGSPVSVERVRVCVWGALWQEDRKCMNFDRKEKMNGQKERWWEGG